MNSESRENLPYSFAITLGSWKLTMMSLRGLSVARLSCSLRGGEEASSYTDSVLLPRNEIEGIMRVARNSGSHAEGGGGRVLGGAGIYSISSLS